MKREEIEQCLRLLPPRAAQPKELTALLEAVGCPEKNLAVLPVAGACGKSSAVGMIAAILQQAGYTVGSYVWEGGALPLWQRLLCNGAAAPARPFGTGLAAILAAAGPNVSRFTVETAAALLTCSALQCDYLVLEMPQPELAPALPKVPVCAFAAMGTNEAREPDLELARRAGQLLRPGCIGVLVPGAEKAVISELVMAAAAADNCELVAPEAEELTVEAKRGGRQQMCYGGYEVPLRVLGRAAAENAVLALETCLALWRTGVPVSDEAILAGLAQAQPRFALRALANNVYVDACRTPEQCVALVQALTAMGYTSACAVLALDGDAPAQALCAALETGSWRAQDKTDKARMAGMTDGIWAMVYPTPHSGANAFSAVDLQKIAKFHFASMRADTLADAVEAAQEAGAECIVLCGSRQIVLDAERYFKRKK